MPLYTKVYWNHWKIPTDIKFEFLWLDSKSHEQRAGFLMKWKQKSWAEPHPMNKAKPIMQSILACFVLYLSHFVSFQKYIGIIWKFLPTLNLSSFGWISKVMSRALDSIWNESKSHEQSPTQWIKQNQLCSQSWRVLFCIFHTLYYFFLLFVSFNKAVRLYVISVNFLNQTFETTWSKIDLDRANLRDCLV